MKQVYYDKAQIMASLTKLLLDAGLDELNTGKAVDAILADDAAFIMEVDRNARAYGWEAAKAGKPSKTAMMSEGNPFEESNWRDSL